MQISHKISLLPLKLSFSPRYNSSTTAIFLLNIGGPNSEEEISPFLTRFLSDTSIVRIPFGLGPLIGKLRGPYKVKRQYNAIGGFSPILSWTEKQGQLLINSLNEKFKEKQENFVFYPAFRYGNPLFHEAINRCFLEHQNLKRIVLFSQFPQYSCTTSGNIIREMLVYLENAVVQDGSLQIKTIDRWFYNKKYIQAIAKNVQEALDTNFTEKIERENALILFTAHSLPYNFIAQGDPYANEIAATADLVSEALGRVNPYKLVWQSKVGFQKWLGPATHIALEALAKKDWQNLVIVPLGFTSDHLETLYEIDIEYMNLAKKLGFRKVCRAKSLNDGPLFIEALSEIVEANIKENKYESKNMRIRCFDCKFESCNKLSCR